MTFSILAFDQEKGTLGAAAATGSLCVGGWVIRGALDAGLVASQGTAPSTFWRDDALIAMRGGASAENAAISIPNADPGRGHRQFSALDLQGRTGAFTGADSVQWAGHIAEAGVVCAGNMIAGPEVLDAMLSAFKADAGAMPDRLLAALRAAEAEGGDSRGLLSSALLVLTPDAPPIDLRIDHSADPLDALGALLRRVHSSPYADWLHEVPVTIDPVRAPSETPTVSPISAPHPQDRPPRRKV